MAEDLKTQFDAIDKLLGLTPFFKCPKCGLRDEDKDAGGTFFRIYLEVSFPVVINDARKSFEFRVSDIELPSSPKEVLSMTCDKCGQEFPLPDEWKWEVT